MGLKVQGKIFFEAAAYDGRVVVNRWKSYNRDEVEKIFKIMVETNEKERLYTKLSLVSRVDSDTIFEELKSMYYLPKKAV
jgi:hypothetical protein